MIRSRKDLAKVKRIVVKVGTSTITYPNCSRNFARMDHLCRELADLHNKGLEVILVTSGAVAVGSERLGLKDSSRIQACHNVRCVEGHKHPYHQN